LAGVSVASLWECFVSGDRALSIAMLERLASLPGAELDRNALIRWFRGDPAVRFSSRWKKLPYNGLDDRGAVAEGVCVTE
jgi:hypothetical protein